MNRVLVIGATGDQGAAQVSALAAAGYAVRGTTRNASCQELEPGIPAVALDLHQPETISAALNDTDTVFLNLPSASFASPETVLTGFQNFLAAAESSAVERIVFNASLYVGDALKGHPAHDVRFRIIEALLDSPIPSTAVCPVIFMDNMLRGWALPTLQQRHVLCYPHASELPVSWIALADVARIMMAVAEDSTSAGEKFVIGGPEALRGRETASALSRAWGIDVAFESMPIPTFAQTMAGLFAKADDAQAERIARDLEAVYTWYNNEQPSPFTVDMSEFLERFPVSLTRVEDWAARHPLNDA